MEDTKTLTELRTEVNVPVSSVENSKELKNGIRTNDTTIAPNEGSATKEAVQLSRDEALLKMKKSKKHLVGENQERMNYLLQASRYINSKKNADDFNPAGNALGSLAMAIGRKCVIRMSSSLKRSLCKGCGSALIPSVSAKVRLRKKRQKHMVVTCNKCKTIKRFVTNPDYVLWSDKPEALS